ncbi:hypothetical protein C8T65DRAFT_709614 [Cerioporus squamosus]|nr:hypothetical protein C8T65DRAFT_709614 [Cerioporus squamosus]
MSPLFLFRDEMAAWGTVKQSNTPPDDIHALSYSFLAALAVVNVLFDRSLVADIRKVLKGRPPPLSSYTYLEDDVPEYFPLLHPRPHVVMSIEESVRYGISEPQSYLEWLWTSTADDDGNVHFGPTHRFGVPSLTHQQHCLRGLRAMLADVDRLEGHDLHHAEHCLSFLREHTLCAADVTLEPGDAFERNFTAERVMNDRRCLDAEAFYASMWGQWTRWSEFRSEVLSSA